jgi:hypothetical protein
MEDSRPLVDQFGYVGILKIVSFQEPDDIMGVLKITFIDLELLGN